MDFNMRDMKALIKMFDESKSDYLSYSKGDFKIKLRKNSGISFSGGHFPSLAYPAANEKRDALSSQIKDEKAASFSGDDVTDFDSGTVPDTTAENLFEVKSPIVGVFYAAKEPGAAPFVRTGDVVEKGQVLCILESMKMLNEVKSPKAGKIVKVCTSNESLVEYGQPLFLIEG